MKNFADIEKFIADSIRVGSQIASDHKANDVQVLLGNFIDVLPPSIAAGFGGQPTNALTVYNYVLFTPKNLPVRRTRKFTIYHPDSGKEIWPGAKMVVSDSWCSFQLQVGLATNPGWGIFADFRNNNLERVWGEFENYLKVITKNELQKYSVLPISKIDTEGTTA